MDNNVTIFIIYIIPTVLFASLLFTVNRMYQTLKLTDEERVAFSINTFLMISNIIYAIGGILMLSVSFSITFVIISPVIICVTQLCSFVYLLCFYRYFSKYILFYHIIMRIMVITLSIVWITVEYINQGIIIKPVPWFMLFISISAIFSFFSMYDRLKDENLYRKTQCSSRDIYIIFLVLILRSVLIVIGISMSCENFQMFGTIFSSCILILICDIFFKNMIHINVDYREDHEEVIHQIELVNMEVPAA